MATFELLALHRGDGYIMKLPASNMQGESFLNRADALRFDLPLYNKNLNLQLPNIYPGKIEIQLKRNGNVIFRGPLWDMTASSDAGKLTCAAEGLESYWDVRRVDWDVKVNAEQSAFMWGLMEDSQALTDGELYITEGTLEAGTFRDFAIRRDEGKYISDVIKDTAKLNNGFDWKIDSATREFNTWYPYKNDAWTGRLEFGKNIKSYALQFMGKWEANDILAQGPKELTATAIDVAQRGTYGLRQVTVSYKDAPNKTALEHFASKTRKARDRGKVVPSISVRGDLTNPFSGGLTWGQTVHVLIKDGAIDFDEVYRCVGFQYTIGRQDNETIVYYLNNLDEIEGDG